jgi:hypothetical protein
MSATRPTSAELWEGCCQNLRTPTPNPRKRVSSSFPAIKSNSAASPDAIYGFFITRSHVGYAVLLLLLETQ